MATICVNYLWTNISLFIFLISLCFLNPKEKHPKEPKPIRIFQISVCGHSGSQSNRKTCIKNSSIANNFFTIVPPRYYKFKNATKKNSKCSNSWKQWRKTQFLLQGKKKPLESLLKQILGVNYKSCDHVCNHLEISSLGDEVERRNQTEYRQHWIGCKTNPTSSRVHTQVSSTTQVSKSLCHIAIRWHFVTFFPFAVLWWMWPACDISGPWAASLIPLLSYVKLSFL